MAHSTRSTPFLQSLLFSHDDLGFCLFREPSERELEFLQYYHGVQSLLTCDELHRLQRGHRKAKGSLEEQQYRERQARLEQERIAYLQESFGESMARLEMRCSITAKQRKYWNHREILHKVNTYSKIHYRGKYKDVYTVPTKAQRLIFDLFSVEYSWKGKLMNVGDEDPFETDSPLS